MGLEKSPCCPAELCGQDLLLTLRLQTMNNSHGSESLARDRQHQPGRAVRGPNDQRALLELQGVLGILREALGRSLKI